MDSISQCQICQQEVHKYCCPRCNVLYCSVKCYQNPKHTDCSESFYKECLIDELSNGQSSNSKESIDGLNAILKKYQNVDDSDVEESNDDELDSDDEQDTDIAARLDGINLNDANAVWSKLTNEERLGFDQFIQHEDISKIVSDFVPWWMQKSSADIIVDLSDESSNDKLNASLSTKIPELLQTIQHFQTISKRAPSTCIKWNIINILGAYTMTVRYFNGEPEYNAESAAFHLINLSANLKQNENFTNECDAIESVICECGKLSMTVETIEQFEFVKNDIDSILQGPWINKKDNRYVLSALSNSHHIFALARKPSTKTSKQMIGEFSKRYNIPEKEKYEITDRNQLKLSQRKIDYLLSYVKEFL